MTKLIGLMKIRNEQWVLPVSLPAAMRVVDELVILDHRSTDRSPEIIAAEKEKHPGRLHDLVWPHDTWKEAAMRQEMLERGRAQGGTHFCVMDADEIFTANLLPNVRGFFADLQPGQSLWLPWLAMWQSTTAYRDDESIWSNNFMIFGFRDQPGIEYRQLPDGYDIHARRPQGLMAEEYRPIASPDKGGVMHLQFANARRLRAKHAWYKMVECVRWPGRMTMAHIDHKYNRALDDTGIRLAEIPEAWWRPYTPGPTGIDLHDPPWHEHACREMWNEYGPAYFEGLELWGVPENRSRETISHG